jgi:hypothetical protein
MKQQDRTRVVARFMQDEDCHVLLASTRAAGLGLNLTRATRVIFMCAIARAFDCAFAGIRSRRSGTVGGIRLLKIKSVGAPAAINWHSLTSLSQAADRVHRIGQQYPCKVTFLQVKNSMDEALTLLQKNKRAQANLTLRGIGTVQGSGGNTLAIRDVYNIMSALDSIYEPVIVANPDKFPEQFEKLQQLNKISDSKRGAGFSPELLCQLLTFCSAAVRAPAPVVPMQHQLILQQPNGPNWLRICAKLNHFPSLQQVHQYDAALKLITDNGHQATEEIYSCIVSEHQKHAKQLAESQRMERAFATSRAATANSLISAFQMSHAAVQKPIAPVFASNFGQRQYLVCLGRMFLRLCTDIFVFRMVRSTRENSRRANSMALALSISQWAAITLGSGL